MTILSSINSTFLLRYKLQKVDEITCDSVNEIKMSGWYYTISLHQSIILGNWSICFCTYQVDHTISYKSSLYGMLGLLLSILCACCILCFYMWESCVSHMHLTTAFQVSYPAFPHKKKPHVLNSMAMWSLNLWQFEFHSWEIIIRVLVFYFTGRIKCSNHIT